MTTTTRHLQDVPAPLLALRCATRQSQSDEAIYQHLAVVGEYLPEFEEYCDGYGKLNTCRSLIRIAYAERWRRTVAEDKARSRGGYLRGMALANAILLLTLLAQLGG